jgi:hypothetical protein
MEASRGPWFTRGVAFVGAGAIALAPLTPVVPTSVPAPAVSSAVAAVSRDFQLTALDIPYLLTLPIIRQYIVNEVQNIAVFFGGFAKSGVGLAQSLLAIPGVTVEAVQQALALDFVGAFNTITSAIRDSVVAVGQPLLDSVVWRAQRADLVQAALQAATPQALIDIANGFLTAGNGVATSLIEGTQNLVAAVLTLNLGNIINAALQGTQNFIVALGAGAGAIVSGIESAQLGIATALATTPPAPPFANVTTASAITAFATPSVDTTTVTLSRAAKTATVDTVDPVAPTKDDPAPVVSSSAVDTVQDSTDPSTPEPKPSVDATPKTDTPKTPTVDATPATDPSTDPAPTGSPKKPATQSQDKVDVSQPVKTSGVDKGSADAKDAGVKKDTGADKDSGSDAKPSRGAAAE